MATESTVLAGHRVGFIGVGAMGGALCRGLARSGAIPASSVIATDVNAARAQELAAETGARVVADGKALVEACDIVVLAVKPYLVATVLGDLASAIGSGHLVIAIAAGVSTGAIERELPAHTAVVRAMPNVGAFVGESATGCCSGHHATAEHMALALALFGAVGTAVQVDEKQMDAVTALSGSGPAYAFLFVEALIDAGVHAGLPRDVARQLATRTVLGAVRMMDETGRHPADLKDMVTTPGGTTISGLAALERAGLRGSVIDAVLAARDRSAELGR